MNTPPEVLKAIAGVCHDLKLPVPGPGAGIEACRVIAAIDRAVVEHAAAIDKAGAAKAISFYRDGLEFVAGVWAHHQKMVIDDLEAAVNGTKGGAT